MKRGRFTRPEDTKKHYGAWIIEKPGDDEYSVQRLEPGFSGARTGSGAVGYTTSLPNTCNQEEVRELLADFADPNQMDPTGSKWQEIVQKYPVSGVQSGSAKEGHSDSIEHQLSIQERNACVATGMITTAALLMANFEGRRAAQGGGQGTEARNDVFNKAITIFPSEMSNWLRQNMTTILNEIAIEQRVSSQDPQRTKKLLFEADARGLREPSAEELDNARKYADELVELFESSHHSREARNLFASMPLPLR